jgi:two-component system, cell cycle response regulator DivK
MRPEDAYVLVIEDNPHNLFLITEMLHAAGVKYVNARSSGWEAIKLAETMPRVDLLLLDLQLPYADGFEVLRQVRQHPRFERTKVVAVTANIHTESTVRARAAGFDGFIGKPLDHENFPLQIRDLLAGKAIWP